MEDLTYRVVIDTESSPPQAVVVIGLQEEEKAIASLQLTADASKEQIDEWAHGQALNYAEIQEEQAVQALKAEEAQNHAEILKVQFENHSAVISKAAREPVKDAKAPARASIEAEMIDTDKKPA